MLSRRPYYLWLSAALVATSPLACIFSADTTGKGPCKSDNECADTNPCTIDTCASDGFCSNDADENGKPDDSNPCTIDGCDGINETHEPSPNGAECGVDLTCLDGKCNCETDSQCGENTDCQKFACVDKACKQTLVDDGFVVSPLNEFDCKQEVCDGQGNKITVPDLDDHELDSTVGDCKAPGCTDNGQPTTVVVADDVPSPGPVGDCKVKTCDSQGNVVDMPDSMDAPADSIPADCKKPGCNAQGDIVDVAAAEDAPPDDGSICTNEGCNGMAPILYEPANNGMVCGADATCESNGTTFVQTTAEVCNNGACVPPITTSCGAYKCDASACYVTCADITQCAPGASCQANLCKPLSGLGTVCAGDVDCASGQCSDGVCCNVDCGGACVTCAPAGFCSPLPVNTTDTCMGGEKCDGLGACKKPNGLTCANDDECINGQCEDGVCCNSDCPGDCKVCNQAGSVGSCVNINVGQSAGACMGNSACDGNGQCKKLGGVACTTGAECFTGFCPNEGASQEVCCDTSCTGPCRSCLASKKGGGSDGVCGFINADTDPDDECSGTCNMANGKACCNGAGACNPP
ncbi:MAG: hypothetical protein IPK82_15795 [Polyangiaceae bacterium]|nr:hypothetical protein [Polyangiaceae bacterium]